MNYGEKLCYTSRIGSPNPCLACSMNSKPGFSLADRGCMVSHHGSDTSDTSRTVVLSIHGSSNFASIGIPV